MTWQNDDVRTMTSAQYKRVVKSLGMSQAGAGRFLGASERTATRYVSGAAKIPTPVVMLLRSMVYHGEVPRVPPVPRPKRRPRPRRRGK